MSKRKKNLHKLNIAALLVIVVLFASVVHITVSIPKKYEEYQYDYISEIKAEIEKNLGDDEIADKMINLRNEYDFDIIVISEDRLKYTSNGLYDFEHASEIVNTGYIFQEVYNTNNYSIWLSVYNIDVGQFIYQILTPIAILAIVQLICLMVTLVVLLRRAIKPLNKLSDIILMLKNDKEIIDMEDQIDEISLELIKVSNDLKLKLYSNRKEKQEYHRRYNLQNNLLYEQKRYLSSVVHDVKSTFLAIKFSSNFLKENKSILENEGDAKALKSIEKSSTKALEFITTSLDNVINDSYSIYVDKTEVNVKQLIEEYFEFNNFLLFENQLKLNITGDECIVRVNLIKVNQLINNILSNMINNASAGTMLEINITKTKAIFINQVKDYKPVYSNSYGMRIINECLEGTEYKYELKIKDGVAIGTLYEVIDNDS